jgi:hypothetical protein
VASIPEYPEAPTIPTGFRCMKPHNYADARSPRK